MAKIKVKVTQLSGSDSVWQEYPVAFDMENLQFVLHNINVIFIVRLLLRYDIGNCLFEAAYEEVLKR